MAAFLGNLRNVVIAGFVLALLLLGLHWYRLGFVSIVQSLLQFVARYLHIASGVMWIGLLWYFNFVSTPTMPQIPTELRPALGKFITPAALFWFRWAAMATLVFGVTLAILNDYFVQVITIDASEGFSNPAYVNMGIGVWLAIIMWFNVWFVI